MKDTCKKCGYWTKLNSRYYKCYTRNCPAYKRDHKNIKKSKFDESK